MIRRILSYLRDRERHLDDRLNVQFQAGRIAVRFPMRPITLRYCQTRTKDGRFGRKGWVVL